jgi:hypothetical protein
METGDRIETFDVSQVRLLRFDQEITSTAPPATAAEPAAKAAPVEPALAPVISTAPAQSATGTAVSTPAADAAPRTLPSDAATEEIPAGTAVVVRMIDSVDSATSQVGQTFLASLDEPLVVNGRTVIAKGADAKVRLVDDKEAGKLTGRTELTLVLDSVRFNGKDVKVTTDELLQQSQSRTKQTGMVMGGIAALGAIIGGIAGGGKGAAIGAVSGGAAGAGVQILTKGPQVKIPSETRLSFVLQQSLKL